MTERELKPLERQASDALGELLRALGAVTGILVMIDAKGMATIATRLAPGSELSASELLLAALEATLRVENGSADVGVEPPPH